MQDESESYMKETFPLISNQSKDLLLYKKLLFFFKKSAKNGKEKSWTNESFFSSK